MPGLCSGHWCGHLLMLDVPSSRTFGHHFLNLWTLLKILLVWLPPYFCIISFSLCECIFLVLFWNIMTADTTNLIVKNNFCLAPCCLCAFQIPECHPDNVPAYPAISHNRSHHQQRCTKAQASSQGLGESHSTGKTEKLLIIVIISNVPWGLNQHDGFSLTPEGVLHIQGPNHGVCGVSLRELRLRQRTEEAEGVRVGKKGILSVLVQFFVFDGVLLSSCTGLNRPTKVGCQLGLRGDMKPPSALVLWSPESQAFNFAAIQPKQIHVWPDLLALTFIQFDFQSGTAVRFRTRLPSL